MEVEEIESLFTSLTSHFNISRSEAFNALFLLYCDERELEHPIDLLNIDLTVIEAIEKLKSFDLNTLNLRIETDTVLIPQKFSFEKKVRFKAIGHIWIIHKNDKDPWPSNPHAHNLEHNIKLDLSTGHCYRKREYIYSLNNKELIEVRVKAKAAFKGELPALK